MTADDNKNSQAEAPKSAEENSASKSATSTSLPQALTNKQRAALVAQIEESQRRTDIPSFRPGDTVKVHAKIVEGNKERIQIFEGVVIERQGTSGASATFTVRKISYNVGVERKFLLHSPRIEKIEVVSRGDVRRAKLYYLRGMRGKAGRIKSRYDSTLEEGQGGESKAKTGGTEGSGSEGSSGRDIEMSQATA